MAYFSNGTEGMVLDDQCAKCPLGEGPCPTYAVHMIFNYDQCDNEKLAEAMRALVSDDGTCQTREQIVQVRPGRLLEIAGQKRLFWL